LLTSGNKKGGALWADQHLPSTKVDTQPEVQGDLYKKKAITLWLILNYHLCQGNVMMPLKQSKPKYGNRLVKEDGLTFQSAGEYRRWKGLQLLERSGDITSLKRQVPFPLKIGDSLVTTYIADFTYYEPDGVFVVEDYKGVKTEVFKIKEKLMKAIHNIKIRITK
jgi:hypothetical protein